MSKQAPFTIKIFVAAGDPDGLRVVERMGALILS